MTIDYDAARRASDPTVRLKAHALAMARAMVPAPVAIFFVVTRRLEVGDAVVVAPASCEHLAYAWLGSVATAEPLDPFALRRVADLASPVLTLADVESALEPARSRYRRYLESIGGGDVACLYLRAAGAIAAGAALLRERGDRRFAGQEVALLRRLHPLLQHAYAHTRRPPSTAEASAPALDGLTPRELDVAQLVATGATNAEIADVMSVTLGTVKGHLTRIYAKLGLRTRTELAVLLRRDRHEPPANQPLVAIASQTPIPLVHLRPRSLYSHR